MRGLEGATCCAATKKMVRLADRRQLANIKKQLHNIRILCIV